MLTEHNMHLQASKIFFPNHDNIRMWQHLCDSSSPNNIYNIGGKDFVVSEYSQMWGMYGEDAGFTITVVCPPT